MADPTFNLKTGADTDLFYFREVTEKGSNLGKIKNHDGMVTYPVLARTTGNSLKGSTESIESNELKKGRTKSAPKQGNSSSEGSIDFEFSPLTQDDMFEAGFRNNWKRWTSDQTSETNKKDAEGNIEEFKDGYFATECGWKDDGVEVKQTHKKRLLRYTDQVADLKDPDKGLILVPKGSVVDELTCGEKDIRYDILKKFGGVKGEDLYQDFSHCAVNTVSMNVEVGQIVTGSFGMMGANDAEMDSTDELKDNYCGVGTDRFLDATMTGDKLLASFPEKATQTDQITAREGFLYLNGKDIEFANGFDMELNNGLEKKFAIMVKNAIATTPLTLDITGNLKTYLVKDGSEEIFNKAVRNEDNEILVVFQDKDADLTKGILPNYIYVLQIFKSKFTDHDASVSGADTLDVSFPYQSFGEKAVRMFRITLPKVESVKAPYDETVQNEVPQKIVITPNIPVTASQLAEVDDNGDAVFSVNIKLDGVDAPNQAGFTCTAIEDVDNVNYGKIEIVNDAPADNVLERKATDQTLTVTIKWHGVETVKDFLIKANV